MPYKIIYHVGSELSTKTKVKSGTLTLQDEAVRVSGSRPLTIPFSEVNRVEMFRLHGLARVLKLVCQERTVFLTVVRINLFGRFVIVNFFRAKELYEALQQRVQKVAG